MFDRAAWKERYSRQMRFAPIGETGQRKLANSCVLIVGVGALGSALAQIMVRSGAGTVRLVDRDYVELSNLQRQSLFDEEDARSALPKAAAAAARLRRINGGVRVEAHVADVSASNVHALLAGVDLVLDGTDNAETRLLMSDACFERGIPFLYGGVAGSQGMCASLLPGETACLRCLIDDDTEWGVGGTDAGLSCDWVGVISPAVEWVAAVQAAEALKWLTGNRKAMRRTWLVMDVWDFAAKGLAMPEPREACPCCGTAEPEQALGDNGYGYAAVSAQSGGIAANRDADSEEPRTSAVVLCGRDTVQVTLGHAPTLAEWRSKLEAAGCTLIADNAYLLKAALPEGERIVLFEGGRLLVQGTSDPDRALELCGLFLLEKEGQGCAG